MELSSQLAAAPHTRVMRSTPHRYDLIATDFILINLSFFLASLITYGVFDYSSAITGRNFALVVFVNIAWGWLCVYFNAYRWYERVRMEQQLSKVFKILVFLLAFTSLFYYNVLREAPHTPFILLAHGLALVLVSTGRVFHRLREESPFEKFRYVIVGGKAENLQQLFKAFDYCFPGSAELVGRFGNTPHANVNNIGGYLDLKAYLEGQPNIDKLIFFYSDLTLEQEKEIMRICEMQFIDVEVAPRETTLFPRTYKSQQLGDLSMLTLKEEPLTSLRNKIMKRVFDLVVSSLVILFIFPILMPIVAIAIYLEDPGPIFFRQERTGYLNNVFRMWKFRSMRINERSDEKQATKGDDRITKVGAFLRKTSLDEFPQFINVFTGEMSVVGPRPHMLKHTEEYSRLIDKFMIRHKVKPGVTGLAQINGYRGPTDEVWKMEKRVEYDVWYLENWSILMDIRCVIMTAYNAFIKGEENAL
ncbi:undecaprenyl-phosphate galactose phosphotransferase/putative colanic acid biosynthesis UDP-glucose lipid carrier transferase [Neolewinella xylanilytica]|uniref:Undecaprenyl-phosphate galactose phosphotransferase/putative colanic acid biosynthesis UDP-glucose lipid carrier transferase n=1 Tax=Neolewinella xylanilytica TaxID=1514080 RepID=A0A2S6I7P3_9BACT|nr:exopolysaccharide biosynthesis polyprenyl glycosylphosphotransferase [Neolewinella xylanilytica]PPK87522.1 undecaprenyl-phosphate galactose phosphotransferase/putative colanic acid biosynthesis UDP-glucose lipid carrier transferase [Neolewinella xylanilytica]